MSDYVSSIWDRVTGIPELRNGQGNMASLPLSQFKCLIARDLEALLNSRTALSPDELAGLPYCKRSILNFGLADFAHLCLTSSDDRKDICDRLQAAIALHEPRLCNVRAQLATESGMVNRLSFVISGQLRSHAENDPIQFDLMLEPSSQRYSIR